MKKFLLSIFAVLFAFAGVQAEEVTKNVTFSDYTAGTQYAENEKHDLGDGLVIYTTACHFTTQLRIYSSATNNGYVVSDALPGTITKMTFNAGYKVDNIVIYGSNDGSVWTQVGEVAVTSTSYKDYAFDFTGSYTRFKLDVKGANQIRIAKMSVTYTTSGEGGGETPDPVDVAEPTFTPADGTTFDESLSVTIAAEDGLTVYYSTDNKVSYTEGNAVNITETTTVYAYAEDAEGNQSDVVEATYTKIVPIDPNAKEVEATISFASTAQRASQSASEQVWQNEGVTFTNSGNVGNYSNPVRLYANSKIVVEHEAMTKILFVCNSSSYATVLGNSIGATATVNGSNVTVTFVNPVDNFTVEKLTAQVRLNSLTVTYLTTQKVVKTPVITPESRGFYAGDNVEVTITAEEGTIYYTTDGNEPTTSSEVYSAPFTVSETTTVKAIAVVDGTESEVATAIYTKGIEGSVADALDAYVDGERLLAAITGYIVGYVDGSSVGDAGVSCVFDSEGAVATNILIADDPYETDYTKCLAVQLPYGDVRTALNLKDNSGNYQVKVVIKASLEKYLSTAGLKDAVSGELIDELYHTLTVTEAGYATLYVGFNARIPSVVEAYTVTAANDGWVELTQVTGVLPANTGVIVKASAGEYKLFNEATATADVTGNLLSGSAYSKNVYEEGYVLGNVDNVVGLYKAEMTDGAWLNNANKAYLPASAVPNKSAAFYGFDWNGTTGIDEITENREQSTVIYDLTGRRVENITAPGIYIVNGVKRVIR